MFKKKNIYICLVILVSLIYSLIIGLGYIGWGIDFYHAYNAENAQVDIQNIRDLLGWKISTLTINNIKLGILITPFLISLSCGYLILNFFKLYSLDSLFLFLIFFILIIFSWPMLNSSNNAMRQGLSMVFIFFSLNYLSYNKKFLSIIFMLLTTFTHKSGIFFSLNLIYLFIFYFFKIKKSEQILKMLIFGLGYFIIYFCFFSTIDEMRFEKNVIIGKDFGILFAIINITYIIFFSLKYKLLNNKIYLFLFFYNFISLAMFANGLYWQHERLNMITLLPIILSFCVIFKKRTKYFYLLSTALILLSLTIYTGMYTYGIGIWNLDLD